MGFPPEHQILRDIPVEDPADKPLVAEAAEPASGGDFMHSRTAVLIAAGILMLGGGFLYERSVVDNRQAHKLNNAGYPTKALKKSLNALGEGILGLAMLAVGRYAPRLIRNSEKREI